VSTSPHPQIVIVDGGELTEVRAVVRDLAVDFLELSVEEACRGPLPAGLLVSTPNHSVALERHRQSGDASCRPLHLVVVNELSRTLRSMLERSTCDVVVSSPVNPDVLRLLAQHALYRGEERRQKSRIAIGEPVKVKWGRRASSATLAQLSMRGCGLVCDRAASTGDTLTVLFPASLTASGTYSLEGRVVSARSVERGYEKQHDIGVVFTKSDANSRRMLKAVMTSRGVGGAALVRQAPSDAGAPTLQEVSPEGSGAGGRQGRKAPRGRFSGRVIAGIAGATLMLIGRDVSARGMRVRPEPSLQLGDELKIALHGQAGVPPIAVRAVVYRDDGAGGLYLRFLTVTEATEAKLETLLAALPSVDGEPSARGPSPGVVVSEVVKRR
jgi:hypothetical protein